MKKVILSKIEYEFLVECLEKLEKQTDNSLADPKWFDHLSAGKQHTDFFANRVTNYSKGHLTWDESIF